MSLDMEKARREQMRWLILLALNSARPLGTSDAVVITAIQPVIPDVTLHELRRELGYLEERGLAELESKDVPAWHGSLTRYGMDIAEYTIECEPGIARPSKYWRG